MYIYIYIYIHIYSIYTRIFGVGSLKKRDSLAFYEIRFLQVLQIFLAPTIFPHIMY